MSMKITCRLIVGLFLLLGLSDTALASSDAAVKKAFNEAFGDDERSVRRTRVTNDDAEFAQKLVQEANAGKFDPSLTVYLYEKAYEYGLRDKRGYQAASDALDQLLELDETRKLEIGEMRLMLWEKWYEADPNVNLFDPDDYLDLSMSLGNEAAEAGDITLALKFLNRGNRFGSRNDSARLNDVRDTISDLMRMRKINQEIEALTEAIGTDPEAADKLAMIYLAELDQPAKAAVYTEQMQDKDLAAKVQLTTTEFAEATPDEASQAGVFYYGLITEQKAGDSIAMLIRSRVWLTEYLSREPDDADSVKATSAMLGEIDAELLKRGIGKKLRRKMSSLLRGEGQFDRPAEIQAAIDKGVQWLYTQRNDDNHWEKDPPNHRNYGGYTALVVYALLMADEEPKLNGDLSRSVHFMMNTKMTGTYPICFRIHAWEVLPRRERYRQNLMKDVMDLRKGATRFGFWGYTMSGNDVKPGSRLDVSTTLAGGLGLWIGEEVGGIAPKKVYWERTARALIETQLEDNGWSYNPATMPTSQGAMTAAGLALLYASYPHLGDVTKAKADEAIERGMKWMDENFSPTTNVNRGGFKNYYFAAVQHAGLFSGKRDFKELDWYESIAKHLVKTQAPDGSMGTVEETAFAVAFLCRGGIVYEPFVSENADPEADQSSSEGASENAPVDESAEQPAE